MTPGAFRREWVVDALAALVLAGFEVRYVSNGVERLGPALALVLAAVAPLPLAWRRRFPLSVLWLVTAGAGPSVLVNPDLVFVACIALCVAIYGAAAHGPHRRRTLASLPVAGAVLVGLFQNAALPNLPHAWVGVLVLLPVALAGAGIRVRRQRDERDRAARAREQAEALRETAGRERARLARELHDVVTHHVSIMVIQAAAARTVLTGGPDEVREAMRAVETSGRAALLELRGVLGALTAGPEADLAPLPDLDAIPALIHRLRGAGVAVEYEMIGAPRPVPQGVGLTAYRVAQEALTNVLKHAAGASVSVVVEYGDDGLRIDVADAGGAVSAKAAARPDPEAGGRGLAGLHERVRVLGGTLQAGRRVTGGFRVRAVLPLEAA